MIAGLLPALVANPSPDPHWPTTESSLFSPRSNYNIHPPSGMFGDVNKTYLEIIDVVGQSVEGAVGGHFPLPGYRSGEVCLRTKCG